MAHQILSPLHVELDQQNVAVIHELGDMKEAKAAGKVRQEGKTYIVQDGDILMIKFNV